MAGRPRSRSKDVGAAAPERPCTERRTAPTFMLPAEPPTWGKVRTDKGFRERIRDWNMAIVGDLNAFPYVVFVNYAVKIYIYCWVFKNKLMNNNENLFAEDNIKRFIIYNVVGDVLGLNSTGGPLGFRVKFFFVTWYNLLMPGSITCPLIPGVSAKRKIWQSAGYVFFVYLLVKALRKEENLNSWDDIAPIVGVLAVLTPFDFVTFQACRGEHSGYMLVCCLFPWAQAVNGLRFCQALLWFWAGVAKIGPWMKYVNAFMMPNSKFIALLGLLGVPISRLLYEDIPRDVNPSKFLRFLAQFGVLMEMSVGPMCFFFPAVGVPLALSFHLYILSMTPFASVMEWNVFCMYNVVALFGGLHIPDMVDYGGGGTNGTEAFTGYGTAPTLGLFATVGAWDPRLQAFLLLVLFAVPLYGQLFPKEVPFLTAFRPYAGNWRFTWHIVDNKAKDKLRKLVCLEGIFISENAQLLWGKQPWQEGNPHFCEQFEDYFTGNMVFFPHFRPLIPMVEKLQKMKGWATDDFTTLFNEIFLNAIMGWTLGTGFYVRGAYFEAVASTCGFEEGECFIATFEPHGLHDHTCEWHLVDICNPDVKIMHGKMPYAELEDMQPCDMTMEQFEAHSVLGKAKDE